MRAVSDDVFLSSITTDSAATTGEVFVTDLVQESEKIASADGSLVFNRGIYRVGGVPNYVTTKNKTGGSSGAVKTTRGGNMSNRSTLSGGTV
jgi:hypothetical protein